MDLIEAVNWMSEAEKMKFKNSNSYRVIDDFTNNYNIKKTSVLAFRSLDTKRIEILVNEFIDLCAVKEFEAFLKTYER